MKLEQRVLAGAIALACSAAASAQVTLYGRENFAGRSLTVERFVPNLRGTRMNDRASSVSVRGGTWLLCSEADYRGTCVEVPPGNYPTLSAIGLNETVSSAREVGERSVRAPAGSTVTRAPAVPPHRVVLFEGPSFSGRSVGVDEWTESLENFNDRARSMIVYDGQWEACEHDRFRGDCVVFGPGRHANLGRLAGDLSSLRPADVSARAAPPPVASGPSRVVIYEGPNFRGRSLVVDRDLVADTSQTGLDDRASSLRVESGSWVLCNDTNFHGQCWTFGPGEYPTLPPALTDQVSSARRIPDDSRYDREPNWGVRR